MKSQATKAASQIRQTKSWRRWRSRSTTCRRPTRSGDLFGGMLGATSGVLSVGGNIAPVHEADGAADASTCKAAAVTASGMGAGASISRGAKATANAEACMSFTQVRRPRTVCLWMRAERERVPKLGNGVCLLSVFLSNRTRRRDGGTRNYRLGFDCAGRAGDRGLLSSFADRPRWAHSPGPARGLRLGLWAPETRKPPSRIRIIDIRFSTVRTRLAPPYNSRNDRPSRHRGSI